MTYVLVCLPVCLFVWRSFWLSVLRPIYFYFFMCLLITSFSSLLSRSNHLVIALFLFLLPNQSAYERMHAHNCSTCSSALILFLFYCFPFFASLHVFLSFIFFYFFSSFHSIMYFLTPHITLQRHR